MRRNEKILSDNAEIERILSTAEVGRLATLGHDGPMIKPVNFAYLDGAFFFHSAMKGEKIDHIKANPKVCFEVESSSEFLPATSDPCDASYRYQSVIAKGSAVFVEEPDEKVKILAVLMEKYQPDGGYNIVANKMTATVVVIRIDVDELTAKTSPVGKSSTL